MWFIDVLKGMGWAAVVVFVIIMIAVAVLSPLITVWALNTLFGFGITYTFKTWFAMLIVQNIVAQPWKSITHNKKEV